MEWLKAYHNEYTHEKSMQEKKAEWEMQRQDAANAKQNAQKDFLARQEKLFTSSINGRSDASKIHQLTKCLI